MTAPLLEFRSLTIEAGATNILQSITVSVASGEVLGVIGESGAGKSTLGLASLGVLRPGCQILFGQVLFDGRDVFALSPAALREHRRRSVAYVAQSAASAFNPAFRLAGQVMEIPRLRGETRSACAARAQDLFARLDLPEPIRFGQRYPHQVSGGQLQRAMLAMALAVEPRLIVFDEPTTALDVTTQLEVLRAIRAVVAERNLAAIYISHDIAVVAQMADRILVLRHGDMVEEGETRKLIRAPSTAYARALIAARQRQDGAAPAMPVATPILEAGGVVAGYGRHPPAVAEIGFRLERGKVLAVVGQSGSGKSTLARVVTGLLPPRAGDLRFDDRPLPPSLAARDRELRRRIQLIQQNPDVALNPRQRVGEAIARPLAFFFGLGRRDAESRARALLAATELPETMVDRLPGSLSGGQKQRVAIARALAADPELLVCDEITSALDPLIEDSIVELLARIRAERGLSMLFITHDLALARRIADDVIVLHQGRIVESGATAVVFDAPAEDYTRRLVAAVPTLEADWLDRQLSA